MHTSAGGGESSTLGLIAHARDDVSRLLAESQTWRLPDAGVVDGVGAAYRLVTVAHAGALTMLGEADAGERRAGGSDRDRVG